MKGNTKMKKFMTMAAILAALTMTVTGCASNNNSSANDSTTSGSVEAGDNTSSEVTDGENDEEAVSLTAAQMAANALTAIEWPAMMNVEDPEMISSFFGIDTGLCEDFYVSNQVISAQLNEVIIVKPAEGKEADLQAQFDAHFEYIKNDAAFYPDQEPSAEGAVMGKLDNGYLYILVHKNAQAAADALLNNPPAELPGAGDDMGIDDEMGVDGGFGVDVGGAIISLEMADIAYTMVEWPAMQPVDDPELIQSFFGIDSTICEDYYIANQIISAQLNEIIIVKPMAGSEDEMQAQLDAHFEYIKNDAAFYPEQEPSAEGAVMGELSNGYKYIFVHRNGDVIEEAVRNAY